MWILSLLFSRVGLSAIAVLSVTWFIWSTLSHESNLKSKVESKQAQCISKCNDLWKELQRKGVRDLDLDKKNTVLSAALNGDWKTVFENTEGVKEKQIEKLVNRLKADRNKLFKEESELRSRYIDYMNYFKNYYILLKLFGRSEISEPKYILPLEFREELN